MQNIMHEFHLFKRSSSMFGSTKPPSLGLEVIQIPRCRNLPPSWMSFVLDIYMPNLRYKKELAVNENHKYPVYIHEFFLKQFSPVKKSLQKSRMMLLIWKYLDYCKRVVLSCENLIKASFYHIFYLSKTSCKLWSGRCSVGKLGEFTAEIFSQESIHVLRRGS